MNNGLYNKILEVNYGENDGAADGYSIGIPTVGELIKILQQLPPNYRVTCCGAENYLYLFPDSGYVTIDNESYLS